MNKTKPFLCSQCGQIFSTKASLAGHEKWNHRESFEETCPNCTKVFKKKYVFKAHIKVCKYTPTSGIANKCSLCNYSAKKEVLRQHYRQDHSITLKENTLEFGTFQEFTEWKAQFELDTKSYYVLLKGSTLTKKQGKVSHYICHRSGCFKSKGRGVRNLKSNGSNKINGFCPAYIKAAENLKGVTVTYVEQHVGHDFDLHHLLIRPSERNAIAEKISSNVPFDEILKEINESRTEDNLERIHLIKKTDLWNIEKQLRKAEVKREVLCDRFSTILERTDGEEQFKLITKHLDILEEIVRYNNKQEVILVEVDVTSESGVET